MTAVVCLFVCLFVFAVGFVAGCLVVRRNAKAIVEGMAAHVSEREQELAACRAELNKARIVTNRRAAQRMQVEASLNRTFASAKAAQESGK